MDVSIIIVNYNSAKLVTDCINSVFDKTEKLSYEIIVVDNDSKDNSVQMLTNIFGDRIHIIASKENLGFGKANNLGAKSASGDYLFLLNPDTILVNNAIYVLWEYLKMHNEVGVVGGNLYTPDMKPTPSHCLAFDNLDTERQKASWRYLIGSKIEQKFLNKLHTNSRPFENEFNYSGTDQKVAYIFGADMMMSRKLFEEVKGFDPDFFMYAEEEELSWRITKQGYSIMNVPEAQIIHLEGATVKEQNTFSEKHFKMRMNGTLTYYKKRFGEAGAAEFFKLRSLRYARLIKIAKIQNKDLTDFGPVVLKRCLKEVYEDFVK